MTDGLRVEAVPLDVGLALLAEQRLAMLAHDSARLEMVNARLSAWIAACRRAPRPDTSVRLLPLQAALDANVDIARRSALQASRALGVLLGPDARLYGENGMASAPARRREVRSA